MQHMLEAARDALSFIGGHSRSDLDGDRMLTLAVVKCIEIIGEAASQVSAECRAQHPSVPWRQATGTRNRLIHGYFEVDLDIVWDTVAQNLPPLVLELEQILAQDREQS
ncbi:MAG TPA: DUF86 domain-containing protein [Thermomicrobiales bacterium]|nr:DUF86 domain-containing protein [Thermomicrobiales bacterium]